MSTPLNVLFIEDCPADSLLIARQLQQNGLAVRIERVADFDALRAAVEQGGWDIVLTDQTVPGLDIQDTLRLLQARQPEVPVILVSGSIGEEKAVELLKQGVCDFVLKDRPARLVPALERSLKEASDRRARRARRWSRPTA